MEGKGERRRWRVRGRGEDGGGVGREVKMEGKGERRRWRVRGRGEDGG